ncbi:hypothetical protein D3C84_824920 [compost metagenome]
MPWPILHVGQAEGQRVLSGAMGQFIHEAFDGEHVGNETHRAIPSTGHLALVPDPRQVKVGRAIGEIPRGDGFGGAVVHFVGALEIARFPLLRRGRRHRVELQRGQAALRIQSTFGPVQRGRVHEQ